MFNIYMKCYALRNIPVSLDTEWINLGRFVSDLHSYGGACQNKFTWICILVNKHQIV